MEITALVISVVTATVCLSVVLRQATKPSPATAVPPTPLLGSETAQERLQEIAVAAIRFMDAVAAAHEAQPTVTGPLVLKAIANNDEAEAEAERQDIETGRALPYYER